MAQGEYNVPGVLCPIVVKGQGSIRARGHSTDFRGVPRIFGGGGARSAKEANKPNKRATELKPRHAPIRGQYLGPTSVCFVESSIFTVLV